MFFFPTSFGKASIPLAAKVCLSLLALCASSLSTSLLLFVSGPYVLKLEKDKGSEVFYAQRYTYFLRKKWSRFSIEDIHSVGIILFFSSSLQSPFFYLHNLFYFLQIPPRLSLSRPINKSITCTKNYSQTQRNCFYCSDLKKIKEMMVKKIQFLHRGYILNS